ncbi:MAG: DUF4260 domain-containing protein [Leeuwenhoekiella sp.]
MKKLLKFEELGLFGLSLLLFSQLDYAWWVFPLCILLPDLSMFGYLIDTKTGALLYNFFHHKGVAIIVFALGFLLQIQSLLLIGIILFGHSAMDRIFGYGLKFSDDFKNTHLGWIGKNE